MTLGSVSCVLLDFFGTLVAYSPSRTTQGFHASHALLRSLGCDLSYEEFLREWVDVADTFEERSTASCREFSMTELTGQFLLRAVGRPPQADEVHRLVATYLTEWNTGVVYPDNVGEIVAALSERFRLAVVTNTHQPDLVPGHLAAMGLDPHIETVVTSVEVGWRKPHPEIYHEALRRLDASAAEAVFVGDTHGPDYAGPEAVGIRAFLIDPERRHEIPEEHRLRAIDDLLTRLDESTVPDARRGAGSGGRLNPGDPP